jgi:hypothetical protein
MAKRDIDQPEAQRNEDETIPGRTDDVRGIADEEDEDFEEEEGDDLEEDDSDEV